MFGCSGSRSSERQRRAAAHPTLYERLWATMEGQGFQRTCGKLGDASLPADDLEAQPGSSFGLLWLKVLKVTSN